MILFTFENDWSGDLSRWGILPISVILQTGIEIWLAIGRKQKLVSDFS